MNHDSFGEGETTQVVVHLCRLNGGSSARGWGWVSTIWQQVRVCGGRGHLNLQKKRHKAKTHTLGKKNHCNENTWVRIPKNRNCGSELGQCRVAKNRTGCNKESRQSEQNKGEGGRIWKNSVQTWKKHTAPQRASSEYINTPCLSVSMDRFEHKGARRYLPLFLDTQFHVSVVRQEASSSNYCY